MAPAKSGLPFAEPGDHGLDSNRLRRVGASIRLLMDAGAIPGALTAIARHGYLVHLGLEGDYAEDTLFRIYSMTKPVTAAAIMILYERGGFFLDDPVRAYLPEFTQLKVWESETLVAAKSDMTLRHLLTHTSGLSYPEADGYRLFEHHPAYPKDRAGVTNETLGRLGAKDLTAHVRALASLPLLCHPGEAWNYGESMAVLARVVEVVSGESFTEFLKSELFDPLDMQDTGFQVSEAHAGRLAPLYQQDDDGNLMIAPDGDFGGDYLATPNLVTGGTGLVSTAADYLRFSQMLLNQGELEGRRVLSPHSVQLMFADHLPKRLGETPLDSLQHPVAEGRGLGFGFGGLVVRNASQTISPGSDGEYSWSGWANTDFWIDPQRSLIGLVYTQVVPTHHMLRIRDYMRQMTYQAVITP